MSDYCFEKFTNDSSDDYPKYSDGLEKDNKFKIALSNVLELARDSIQNKFGSKMPPYDDGGMAMECSLSADEIIARESVKFIESTLN